MKITPEVKARQLVVYVPDTRGVTVSRFGKANVKIGMSPGVYTYSRLPGSPKNAALGSEPGLLSAYAAKGTCPGATEECQAICYAARPVAEAGVVYDLWHRNSLTESVPTELPHDAWLVRIHVSGDFSSNQYIRGWLDLVTKYPAVKFWAYTRSWRCPELLAMLELLRALPNMQLFASMDNSTIELPPSDWRIAWIDGDPRLSATDFSSQHQLKLYRMGQSNSHSYICPEETGKKANCEDCRYCFDGQRNDVTFLKH